MLCILIVHFGNVDADLDYKNEKLEKKRNALLLVSFSRVLIATQEFNLGDLKCSMHLHKSTLQSIVA